MICDSHLFIWYDGTSNDDDRLCLQIKHTMVWRPGSEGTGLAIYFLRYRQFPIIAEKTIFKVSLFITSIKFISWDTQAR